MERPTETQDVCPAVGSIGQKAAWMRDRRVFIDAHLIVEPKRTVTTKLLQCLFLVGSNRGRGNHLCT